METYQNLRQQTQQFLQEIKLNNPEQAFIIGAVCGYFLQHKGLDSIEALKEQIKSCQQIIIGGFIQKKHFEDMIKSLITNLEQPQGNNFQEKDPGTPILEEQQQFKDYGRVDQDEAATLALIKQLQAEDAAAHSKRQVEIEQVDCPICFTTLMDDEVIPLECCIHIFHLNCLKEVLLTSIQEKRKQIICPQQGCNKELSINDIVHIVGIEKKDEYLNYTLNHFVDQHADEMSWCPTPDCKYAFMLGDEEDNNNFTCPLCKKCYCLNCRVIYHKGQTCKEYQVSNTRDKNDEKFEKFVKGHKFKMCSKCKFWVEKNQGCNHMTCRCGYQFCYACGGKYLECECVQKQRESMLQLQQRQQQLVEQRRLQKKSGRGRR